MFHHQQPTRKTDFLDLPQQSMQDTSMQESPEPAFKIIATSMKSDSLMGSEE